MLILAGGGGHTGIAFALAQSLHRKVSLSFIVPKGDILSRRRLSRFGEVQSLVKPRGPKTHMILFAVRLAKALLDSCRIDFHEFDIVVSTGSNFCGPPALLAWMRGVPVINIESLVRFTKPSRTARILQPISRLTVLHWQEQRRFLRGVVVGPTLRKPEIEPWNGGYILVSGGTYGHRLLFDALSESKLDNVILQTGRVDPTRYMKRHPEWKITAWTERFHELLAGAELVVSHFGGTILDAAIYGKPVVLVLNPEWTRTVGIEDAEILAKKVNAVLVSKIELANLLNAIDEARKRRVPIFPDGAGKLADIITKLLCDGHN
ncbi:MAG: hypothetical protein JSW53_00695 [Candidatus Bathyarchaeota archaeon]|nr:MAG: hypothetical protein JSW53_00695 [Candidatus Bathyarchaeota archaeon]